MFVPCPDCGFLVALAAKRAGTSQHCPRCHALIDDGSSVVAGAGAAVEPGAEDKKEVTATTPASTPAAAPSATPPPPAPAAATAASGPSFALKRIDPHAAAPRWPRLLAVAGLALLLVLQLLLAQRAELAAQARWRPLLGALCTVLPCDLPPWHQPTAWAMLDRSVRPAPDRPGVLQVNASFRNDARWAQAWPTLVLSLSDADGRQVGQRAFAPVDYRGDHATGDRLEQTPIEPALIEPGQSATVAFQVIEPAPHIVAFTFDFR